MEFTIMSSADVCTVFRNNENAGPKDGFMACCSVQTQELRENH